MVFFILVLFMYCCVVYVLRYSPNPAKGARIYVLYLIVCVAAHIFALITGAPLKIVIFHRTINNTTSYRTINMAGFAILIVLLKLH